jgi:hypothetical protein
VQLAGGLGNQLFQLASALSSTTAEMKLILIKDLASVRGQGSSADVEFLELDSRIVMNSDGKKKSKLIRKVANLATKVSARSYEATKDLQVNHLTAFIASLYFSIYFKQHLRVQIAKGIGFHKQKSSKGGMYRIGYYQSDGFLSESALSQIGEGLDSAFQKRNSETSTFVQKKCQSNLIVHVRRTDYLDHPHFGLLNEDYYNRALAVICGQQEIQRISVFSDDISLVRNEINFQTTIPIEWIDSSDELPADTLQRMRYGSAYILANSTFGWWAARLSKCNRPSVVVPTPWFADAPEPKEMHPSDWIKVHR